MQSLLEDWVPLVDCLKLGFQRSFVFRGHGFERRFVHVIIVVAEQTMSAAVLAVSHDDVVLLVDCQVLRILTQNFPKLGIPLIKSFELLLDFTDGFFLFLFLGSLRFDLWI